MDAKVKFALAIIQEINQSYAYWWSSDSIKQNLPLPMFDKNQTLKLLQLYRETENGKENNPGAL